jgi:hypothetical protein
MDERCKHLYLGFLSMKLGYNVVTAVSQKFNTHKHTVRREKKELLARVVPPAKTVHQKGGGKKNFIP